MSDEFKHTPGPWRWEFNATSKTLQLCGGIPKFDKTVMDFTRWGMGGASPRFNGKHAGDDHNILFRPSERQDWMVPFPGREHHASWLMDITHPDAQLIASAPDLAKRVYELEEANAKLAKDLEESISALKGLFANPHLNLGDQVYVVRESELQGWDGPAVTQWSEAVAAANAVMNKHEAVKP